MGKSEVTKQRLFQTALKLFAQENFDKVTMRVLAKKAQVAPGAIYYYFASKEAIVQEYYHHSHEEHEQLMTEFFHKEKDFEKRLHKLVQSKIELAQPYKSMARALYRVAADPDSSLSPFSADSRDTRLRSLKLFEEAVRGSRSPPKGEIGELLPKYLWFYQMGLILYWIYDTSENSQKTFELIDKTVPLLIWMNDTLQSAWAAPFRKKIISTLKSFEPDLN